MKTMLKKSLWVILPVLALVLTAAALAAPEFGRILENPRIVKELKLTPEQEKSLKDLRFEAKEKSIDIDARIKKARLQMEHEMEKDDVNREKVMGLLDEIGKQQTELKKIGMGNLIEIKKILTPEQREKGREMLAKWRAAQEKKGGMERPMGPGMRGGEMRRGREEMPMTGPAGPEGPKPGRGERFEKEQRRLGEGGPEMRRRGERPSDKEGEKDDDEAPKPDKD